MDNISGDTLRLLEELEVILDEASNIPLTRKVAVDKESMLEIIKDIKIGLPNQFKQADWINKEKQKILDDAKRDADSLIEKTEAYVKEKVSEDEITKLARENARMIEQEASLASQQIKDGARRYAVEMLSKLSQNLNKIDKIIENNIDELENFDL